MAPPKRNISVIDLTDDTPPPESDPPSVAGGEGIKQTVQKTVEPSPPTSSSDSNSAPSPIIGPSSQVPPANPTLGPILSPGTPKNGQKIISSLVVDLTRASPRLMSPSMSSNVAPNLKLAHNRLASTVGGPVMQNTPREDPRKVFLEKQAEYEAAQAIEARNRIQQTSLGYSQQTPMQRPSIQQVRAQQAPMGGIIPTQNPQPVQTQQLRAPQAPMSTGTPVQQMQGKAHHTSSGQTSLNGAQHSSQQVQAPHFPTELVASLNALLQPQQVRSPPTPAGQVISSNSTPVQQTPQAPSPQIHNGQLTKGGPQNTQLQGQAPQLRPGQVSVSVSPVRQIQTQAPNPPAPFRPGQASISSNGIQQLQQSLSPQSRANVIPNNGINIQQVQAQQRTIGHQNLEQDSAENAQSRLRQNSQLQRQQHQTQAPAPTVAEPGGVAERLGAAKVQELRKKLEELQKQKAQQLKKEQEQRALENARIAAESSERARLLYEEQERRARDLAAAAAAAKERERLRRERVSAELEAARRQRQIYISDLNRPRTKQEHDLESAEIARNQHKYGSGVAWSPEILSSLLFLQSASMSSAILDSEVEAKTKGFFEAADKYANSSSHRLAKPFLYFLDAHSVWIDTWLTRAVSIALNEPPSQKPKLKSYYVQMTPKRQIGFRMAEQLTVPLMEKLRAQYADIDRIVGGFDKFYVELNSSIHEIELNGRHLIATLAEGVANLANRCSVLPEALKDWRISYKRSELPMILYGNVFTNIADRLYLNLEHREGNHSCDIPLCSIVSENTSYPDIVKELLIQAHNYPCANNPMAFSHICTVYVPFVRVLEATGSMSVNVAIYWAPAHALRYMVDRASGHLPSQVNSDRAPTDRKDYYESHNCPKEMKMKAPGCVEDFKSEYYQGIRGWNEINLHICNLGSGQGRREAAEVMLRSWMETFVLWEESKARGMPLGSRDAWKRKRQEEWAVTGKRRA